LGKYTTTPPIDLREDMEAFWLNAGGHFPDVPKICIVVFKGKWWQLFRM
jgi:hypothetical protein